MNLTALLKHVICILTVGLINLFLLTNSFSVDKKLISIQANGLITALGDFDSDKLTDLFIISPARNSFQVLRATNKPDFIYDSNLECNVSGHGESIVGLIPGDFSGKAFMDVVVITRDSDHSIGDNDQLNLYLVPGDRNHLECRYLRDKMFFAQVTHQPLALDYNGDMIVDLFARDINGQRYIYTSIKESNVTRVNLTNTESNIGKIRSPNSNGFIDLNGDFRSDLIIENDKSMEYWYHSSGGFVKTKEIPYPNYKLIGLSTLADMNGDGIVDHILPVCSDSSCSSTSTLLALDGAKNEWFIVNDNFPDVSSSSSSSSSPPPPGSSLLFSVATDDSAKFIFPLKLRQADVDGDGFPDLLGLMKSKDKPNIKVIILQNIKNATNPLGRSFVPRWLIEGGYESTNLPILTAWADISEDGKADVIINSQGSGKSNYAISVVLNDQMYDACFLKVLVTSGLCYGDCPSIEKTIDGSAPASPIPYGTNQPGPAITYQLVDASGNRRAGFAGQLSQSSDFSLQMPYTIFGLGQFPNFVDNLTASIPAAEDNSVRVSSWLQIVPDAQVVVIPYPPSDPKIWRTKLFITPSDIVISTLITLTCICVVLALIILLLHRKEVLEDLAEHEEYKRHWPESR
ncbi:T-cell immunomodulatory protein-like [Panonychus citri]|uniref:T-cell immunomodulatory protein-like n=1 Tax=Panonychus citri TaxID=50023 RepID=UPI002306E89D|nr:T-cell immunomodulatory protein-like [Panonychus citri]